MQIKSAIITEVDILYQHRRGNKLWIQFDCNEAFPVHHTFLVANMADLTRIEEVQKFTKTNNLHSLVGKKVRLILEQVGVYSIPIAIGSETKNRFVDLYFGEFPVSERRIFRRYELSRKARLFISNLKLHET